MKRRRRRFYGKDVLVDSVGVLKVGQHKYRVGLAPLRRRLGCMGLCSWPERGGQPGVLLVSSDLVPGGAAFIETCLHETLHAIDRRMGERAVTRRGKILAGVLLEYLRATGVKLVRPRRRRKNLRRRRRGPTA